MKVKIQVYVLYPSHKISGSLIDSIPTWNVDNYTFQYPEFKNHDDITKVINTDLDFKYSFREDIENWFIKSWSAEG